MASSSRLPSGGVIDRDRWIGFRFDGRSYRGHPGDTLASALLANGVMLTGRSFKYHRPRGILSAGFEEPNALAELRSGPRREPNSRMTMIELFDGLEARSQNCFPSLRFDISAVNQLLAPIIPAGFYYKTFMWPKAGWERLFEPLIRRAAGLGRAAGAGDPDSYEHRHAHADVVVIGGGVAGMEAALAAAEGGARVILIERQPWLGGQAAFDGVAHDGAALADLEGRLRACQKLRILPRTAAIGRYDGNVIAAVEHLADHLPEPASGQPRQRLWLIRPRQVIIATGAQEQPLLFAGNDRPGVMLSGAVRGYLNRFGVAVGGRIVVVTCDDDAYRTAAQLAAAGIAVPLIADLRADPGPVAARAEAAGTEVLRGAVPLAARGRARVRALDLRDAGGRLRRIVCDTVAICGGFAPRLALLGHMGDAGGDIHRVGAAAIHPTTPCQFALPGAGDVPDKAFVDLQNDVTVGDLRLALREGYEHPEHMKRYTTLGMGIDQGATSGTLARALAALLRGLPDAAPPAAPRARPPALPAALGVLAGHARGPHYQPERLTPLHDRHAALGAEFVEAGLWLRPRAYPRPGEALPDAIARELVNLRQAAGLCDVSTLGKIEVFGPDAGAFLNRIYANRIDTLGVGRARYGIMLREDGHVLDDGTVSRLRPDHYLLTTTTANAARVLAHLEFHAQIVWPGLGVAICPVTDQWCAMALAGPRAPDVLAAAGAKAAADGVALPFMGLWEGAVQGIAARIFRISYSGERAYEILVPARHGPAFWDHLLRVGADQGLMPYGTEAMGVARIEKGHPAGPEIDGRTTAADLGMGHMLAAKVAAGGGFVGQAMAGRVGLADLGRPRLVGIAPVDPAQRLRAGAHLARGQTGMRLEHSEGWISSTVFSPTLGGWIALGFLAGGDGRRGERLFAHYPLAGETVAVDIRAPCFLDPEGVRARD